MSQGLFLPLGLEQMRSYLPRYWYVGLVYGLVVSELWCTLVYLELRAERCW